MSRIMKCICDGCGAEINNLPFKIHVIRTDLESDEFVTDEDAGYYHSDEEYCESCMAEIVKCIERLRITPEEKELEVEQKASDKQEQMVVKKKEPSLRVQIRELLSEGKKTDEIIRLTGCERRWVYDEKYVMNKKAAEDAKKKVENEPKVHACSEVRSTCRYAGKTDRKITCDYILLTGHRRGCLPEECTRYVREER